MSKDRVVLKASVITFPMDSLISQADEAQAEIYWRNWLTTSIDSDKVLDDDFGLSRIAAFFGKDEAVAIYWEACDKETNGDIDGAIKLYKKSFRMWPALDSVLHAGLPLAVGKVARSHGGGKFFSVLMDPVDITSARASAVMFSPSLMNRTDLAKIESVRLNVVASEDIMVNNPENTVHLKKVGTFLNNPPEFAIYNQAPTVVGKMLSFASEAWSKGGGMAQRSAQALYIISKEELRLCQYVWSSIGNTM